MARDPDGTWRLSRTAEPGERYGFVVDGKVLPDPAARRQDGDVHASSVLDPPQAGAGPWRGRPWHEAAILELHVGTFTAEGTFAAAARRLPGLAAMGLTFIEVMPIAQFSGRFGWGYDGVLPYAVHPAYGTPADFAGFVAAAHEAGLGVILDVVYNHFGPDGAYMHDASPAFFDEGNHTPWGAAFDVARAPVREFFLQNAEMWLREFGVDGLRLDAVHAIPDKTPGHLVEELADRVAQLDLGRPLHLVTEDESNLPRFVEAGVTASWNDDYHHAVHCLTTGESEGYYAPFAVDPMGDLLSALNDGQVAEGQPRPATTERRGAPSGHLPVTAFVNANETHDQVGNRARGERLISLIGPEAKRVLHAMLLCAPYIPMLFMGEEAGSRRPFQFFADFDGDLADAVRTGRTTEFKDFAGFAGDLPDPVSPATRDASRPYDDPEDDAEEWRALSALLLRHRADRVAPLIATPRQRADITRTGERALRAVWHFASGRIEMEANLGTAAAGPTDWTGADITLGSPEDAWAFMTRVVSA